MAIFMGLHELIFFPAQDKRETTLDATLQQEATSIQSDAII